MKPIRLTLLLLLALAACSGGNDDDDDDITTVPDDDDDVTTANDDDDDVTSNDDDDVTDDDDDTTPEIIERSFVVTDSITFYWNEDANDPVTPAPSAAALAGEVPGWDEEADAMRLTPVLEGLPSGTAFPLGARWEIAIDEATRGALEELLPDAYAIISDVSGTEYAYDIYDDAQFVIPVEHFSSFAVLLGAGSLGGGIGGGNSALIAFLSAIIGGGGPLAGILTDLFLGVTCGNGALDDFEACDGDVACESFCYSGAMACSDDCKVLDSACNFGGQECGNSALEGCEVCDGDSQECFNGCYFGANACAGDCAGFDATCDTGEQACGNGLIEGCEVCDDGAANGSPGMCNTACSFPNKIRCGNLVKEGFEICDGGTADCNDGCYDGVKYCYNDCNGYGGCEVGSQRCGNGKVEGCEACDDGPLGACLDDCTGEATEFCGDGYVTGAEECDALGVDTASCDSDCTKISCGDAHPNAAAGETCDDGPGGSCFDDCSAQNVCGDSIVFAGEVCDDGPALGCHDDCLAFNFCGDAIPYGVETCDDGPGGACHDDCSAVNVCGDGIPFAGEVCDDGPGGTCHDDCSAVNTCGDGIAFGAGEACDDGPGGTCHDDCSAVNVCGDGIPFAGEVCDDGLGGTCHDDCSAVNVCGDGILFGGGEICDDGDTDSCTPACNSTCSGPGITAVCGDNFPQCAEVCDDGADNGTPNFCNGTCDGYCDQAVLAAPSASGPNDGLSWATATQLNLAVLEAKIYGINVVWALNGTYTATSSPMLAMLEGVDIYGSFDGTECVLADRTDPMPTADAAYSPASILDGGGTYQLVVGANNSLLNGFTLTRGDVGVNEGSAIYNYGVAPTYRKLRVTQNQGNRAAVYNDNGSTPLFDMVVFVDAGLRAVFNASSAPVFTSCRFASNQVEGATREYQSTASYTNTVFISNASNIFGGAIIANQSALTIDGCAFDSNSLSSAGFNGGGALALDQDASTITNSSFAGNSASATPYPGGAAYIDNGSTTQFTGCNFTGNTADAGAALAIISSTVTLTGCSLTGNTAAFFGGGIYNTQSPTTIDGGSITGNAAMAGGGGIYDEQISSGLGIIQVNAPNITGNVPDNIVTVP